MRIGIFGGTFDPPHIGHLIVAEYVRLDMALDTLYFVPSYQSPHKRRGEKNTARHRLRMTELAVLHHSPFSCLSYEVTKKRTSYSYHTIEYLLRRHPTAQLYLIMGMDNFRDFHTWKHPRRILSMASLVVMNRPSFPVSRQSIVPEDKVFFVDVPDLNISSSMIRDRLRSGSSAQFLLPSNVLRYIEKHKLYRSA